MVLGYALMQKPKPAKINHPLRLLSDKDIQDLLLPKRTTK